MEIAAKKLELLDWLLHVTDETIISQLDRLRKKSVDKTSDSPKFGRLKGKIRMADDFNAPLDDFKEYM
jgi:hypothetical protein